LSLEEKGMRAFWIATAVVALVGYLDKNTFIDQVAPESSGPPKVVKEQVRGGIAFSPQNRWWIRVRGKVKVLDAHTLLYEDGTEVDLRGGIDAPDLEQRGLIGGQFYPCGREAANFLRKLIGDEPVTCFAHRDHVAGKKVRIASAFVGESHLNIEMVRHGWAISHHSGMDAWEIIAREKNRGMWRGTFIVPERWRKGDRLSGEDQPPAPLPSGPQRGERLPGLLFPTAVLDVQNPGKSGDKVNFICRYAYEPMVLLFARHMDDDLAKLIKRLDFEVGRRGLEKLRVVVTFLSEDEDAASKQLRDLAARERISGVNLAVNRPESLRDYKLTDEAALTVILYHGSAGLSFGKCQVNYAFRKGEFKSDAVERLFADIADLCLRIDPGTERAALAKLQPFQPIVKRDEVKTGNPVVSIQFRANVGKVTDSDLALLTAFPHLRSVDLPSKPLVTDAGLAHLAGLTRLEELNVNWTRATSAGILRLVKDRPKFRRLELGGVKFHDEDLSKLSRLTDLRTLSLRGTLVTDKGVEHLKPFTKLTVLSLMSTKIGDPALAHLEGLTELEDLDLDRTAITDAGLVPLKSLRKLRRLQMAHTTVTDAGLEHLQVLSNLKSLNVRGTKVTKEAVDRLQKRLPELQVGFGPAPK
jgi:endonuclease YncB( thermonuclease family)